jgi:hypothetical protein
MGLLLSFYPGGYFTCPSTLQCKSITVSFYSRNRLWPLPANECSSSEDYANERRTSGLLPAHISKILFNKFILEFSFPPLLFFGGWGGREVGMGFELRVPGLQSRYSTA